MTSRAVVLFARTPEAEVAAKHLPLQRVALFEKLIGAWLSAAEESGATPVIACAVPDRERFDRISPHVPREYVNQIGRSFGERLANTARMCRAFSAVAIVGIDTKVVDLERVFEAVESNDAVIAPACDGGINLIAYRDPPLELLRSFAIGDASIAARCIAYFPSVQVLAASHDFDALDRDSSLQTFEGGGEPPHSKPRSVESLRAPPQ